MRSSQSVIVARILPVLLWTVPILATLAGTALLVALPLTWLGGGEHIQPGHLLIGTVCGLIVWLFVSVFHLKKETVAIPYQDREVFVERLAGQLHDLGYEVHHPTPNY